MTTRVPASRTARSGRVTKEAIAREALTLVRLGGVEAVTMRAVAERLSVRAPSLYEHVAGKGELLELLAREAFAGFAANTQAYAAVRTVEEWIATVVDGSVQLRRFYVGHSGLAALMLRSVDPSRDRMGGSRGSLVAAQIRALLRIGIPETDARSVFGTMAFWTLAAVAAEGVVQSDVDAAERDARFAQGLNMLVQGVRIVLLDALRSGLAESNPSTSGVGR